MAERIIKAVEDYLYLPVSAGSQEKKLEIFLEGDGGSGEKLFELMIPVDESGAEEYAYDYFAELPTAAFRGGTLRLCGDLPQAFLEEVKSCGKEPAKAAGARPAIHFTAGTGWTNDPNGLIYADGVYHFYFQYNPFNTSWNNMSWGHAVSRDLLHWEQQDTVLFPDGSGTMFSGCAIAGGKGMAGLPEEALLYYYTAAGGTNEWSKGVDFTQKIAYSTDGGRTLTKLSEPCLGTVCRENRDPKVFWHEESRAYVMVLWLKEDIFGIFRSTDGMHWEQSDELRLEGAWECPDLFYLRSEEGEGCWFFWAADGFCYPGEFDGYRFRVHGVKRHAYRNKLPYAAQTYSGVQDRVISIPWLRMENDGRLFTGTYGIPVELSCKRAEDGFILIQKPVRELMECAERLEPGSVTDEKGQIFYQASGERKALVVRVTAGEDGLRNLAWEINGSRVEYDPLEGQFVVDGNRCPVKSGCKELELIVDDRILEVFFDGGVQLGTFLLQEPKLMFGTSAAGTETYVLYEVPGCA